MPAKAMLAVADATPGCYVVMRHEHRQAAMRCRMLHPTYASAHAEAQRLCGASIEEVGPEKAAKFYVLRIVDRVGIFDDRLVSGGVEL
jgi:hypothetical protein